MNRDEFYETIFNKHLKLLKRVVRCTIYSDDLSDIEDCIQNTLLIALKKNDLQNHPNIEGWLYLTAQNVTMQFNHEYLKRDKYIIIADDINGDDDNDKKYIPSVSSFFNQLMEDIEFERLMEQGCIKKVLKSLSKTEKHFFILRYINKYDNKQISEITGKSEIAVRVRYSRLKEKIENIIKSM